LRSEPGSEIAHNQFALHGVGQQFEIATRVEYANKIVVGLYQILVRVNAAQFATVKQWFGFAAVHNIVKYTKNIRKIGSGLYIGEIHFA